MSKPRRRLTAPERREIIAAAATELFAERGYAGTSMSEIARRSDVSVPVVYDHFPSKPELHAALLERTRDELLEMWREHLAGSEPPGVRIPRAIEAWAEYVESHPYAARMFFRETTGDPAVVAIHRRVTDQARSALGAILGGEPGAATLAGSADAQSLEMAAEVIRSGLTGLAVWWLDHPEVPRERIVNVAVGALWVGFERMWGSET